MGWKETFQLKNSGNGTGKTNSANPEVWEVNQPHQRLEKRLNETATVLELLGINFIFCKNKASSAIRRYFAKIARTEVCQRLRGRIIDLMW